MRDGISKEEKVAGALMKITFLGTGTSHGVPVIACRCNVCTSTETKNQRTRPSIVVTFNDRNILVDTSPELRIQALRCGVERVDAILFTHSHADHLHGLDDVRAYTALQDTVIPCYGSPKTVERIRAVFHYAFKYQHLGVGIPQLELVQIQGDFQLFGVEVIPLNLQHGKTEVLGFRIGNFAYATDCNQIPPESMDLMRGLDLLVLDALRWSPPNPTHFTIPESLKIVEQLKSQRTYFVHMSHDVEHHDTNSRLPEGVELAYDGLVVEI
jgi:phosphoribosyl 1,2-cyclic phosphate phosphodiesterase